MVVVFPRKRGGPKDAGVGCMSSKIEMSSSSAEEESLTRSGQKELSWV
jgi:hypothetical protein